MFWIALSFSTPSMDFVQNFRPPGDLAAFHQFYADRVTNWRQKFCEELNHPEGRLAPASTFNCRVATSTFTDAYSAIQVVFPREGGRDTFSTWIASAISTLRGPLHGGANEAAMELIPALAGFQSEHAVEIPFMLTTTTNDSENPRTGIKTAAHWRCLGLF